MHVVILVLVAFVAVAEAWRLWVGVQSRRLIAKAKQLQDEVQLELANGNYVCVGHSWAREANGASTFTVEYQDADSFVKAHKR